MRWGGFLIACSLVAAGSAGAAPRRALGIYEGWGAFRSEDLCYAIAQPAEPSPGSGRPFVAVLQAPRHGARAQVHVRLRAPKQRGRPVTLSIGDQHFALIAGADNAWAADAAGDAAIVAAMRSGTSLSIETRGRDGRPMIEVYKLGGAATAIDAAALGCAPRP